VGVVVAYLYPEQVSGKFMESMTGAFYHDVVKYGQDGYLHPSRGGIISMSSGPRVAHARNSAADEFLHSFPLADWLVFIDSDMVFADDAIHRLVDSAVEYGAAVMGGLCFAGIREGEPYPTAYRIVGEVEGTSLPDLKRIPLDALPDGVARVDATGTGFVAIHRGLLNKIWNERAADDAEPWFAELRGPNGIQYGEDITFCLRARKTGAPIMVDTDIKIGHMKSQMVGEVQ